MGLFDRLTGGDEPRVAFVGIDGVPHSLVTENPETFPNLTALAEEGSAGPIESIVPPESSACWPSLTTGVNPGETGVYGFTDREVGTYDTYVPMGRDVQADRVWDYVEEEGRDATVLSVPVTFPPQRDVQRMVSGFLSPGLDEAAYPDDLRDYLESVDYPLDVNPRLGHQEDKSDFVENANETLDAHHEAFLHYAEQDDWDLFFGVHMATDRVNHFLFKDYAEDGEYREEFLEFYAKLDRYLGEFREALADDVTLVVASDHGFTSLDHEVHFNEWLRQNGWLDYVDRYAFDLNAWLAATDRLAYAVPDPEEVADLADDTDVYGLTENRTSGARVYLEDRDGGTVSEAEYEAVLLDLQEALESLTGPEGNPVFADVTVEANRRPTGEDDEMSLVPPESGELDLSVETTPHFDVVTEFDADAAAAAEGAADAFTPTAASELDHVSADTRAYSFIPGRFYLNLEGREPRGSVPEEDYREVRDELKAELEALEGPDGRPVCDRVVEKEAAFDGAHDDIAPDLVAIPNHGFDLKAGFGPGEGVFGTGPRNGMHSFDNATLFVDDPEVRVDGDVNLFDITPTLLDLLEVDHDVVDFDGRSLA